MEMKWQTLPTAPQEILDEHPEITPLILTLLTNRGVRDSESIRRFLNPTFEQDLHDPMLFRHMKKAVDRILQAIEHGEKITVHGDYDADGVTASVILTSTFRAMGYENTDVYLPHRETDGYGLNLSTVEKLHNADTKVIITCDCGIGNVAEVDLANSLGIDVIITDHHSIPAKLPEAYAIIHPKIEGETYPDQTLAGGGVAYKLMQGMLQVYAQNHDKLTNGQSITTFEKLQLDMAAIASVADMVPLLGESRAMTRFGLEILNLTKDGKFANPREGLKKFFEGIGILYSDGTLSKEIRPDTIGFQIAPRINAAGRLDHANVAYELLMTDSPTRAVDLAHQLEKNNNDRKDKTSEIIEYAVKQFETKDPVTPIIFILGNDWPSGLNGLVASRMVERYSRPAYVATIQDGIVVGSGRSKSYFNMIEAMQKNSDLFIKFGGHPMACGFSCAPDKFEEMSTAITKVFHDMTIGVDTTPTLDIDVEARLEDIDLDLCYELEKLEPYGQMNPKPLFVTNDVSVKEVQTIGKDHTHLKLTVYGETPKLYKMIGWKMAGTDSTINWSEELETGSVIDVVYRVDINEWNGRYEPQLTIVDIKKKIV
jgi:single-stranded-DNA-specific exonuclease